MYVGIQESPMNQLLKIHAEVCLMDHIHNGRTILYSHHTCRKFISAYLTVLGIFWVCFILIYFILSYHSFNMAALEDLRRYLYA